MERLYVSINYNDGGNPLGYESIETKFVFAPDEQKKIFNSGDFELDWFNMIRHAMKTTNGAMSFSSSVDHVIMDMDFETEYKLMFFGEDENGFFLKNREELDLEEACNLMQVIVKGGTNPTWGEYYARNITFVNDDLTRAKPKILKWQKDSETNPMGAIKLFLEKDSISNRNGKFYVLNVDAYGFGYNTEEDRDTDFNRLASMLEFNSPLGANYLEK